MEDTRALAVDLGASGGKLVMGQLEQERATFELVHRFTNRIVTARGRFYWDFLNMLHEIKQGYAKAQSQYGGTIRSIAIDSWCNDYALLTQNGTMIGSPRNYRDMRTRGWIERADKRMPMREVYQRTGQQFAPFETCYHLLAEYEQDPELLSIAHELIFVPDYLSYLLGARKYTEYTIASVTNLYDITKNEWDADILRAYGIDRKLFLPVVAPGTEVGSISEEVCEELKTPSAAIYTAGSHDTASAVAAAPVTEDEPFLFLSSGTWSLMGAEIKQPILTEESLLAGFGNEGGVCGRIRYLKNIMGLWLLQECVRVFAMQGRNYDFAELAQQAEKLGMVDALVDPDDAEFFEPKDMPSAIVRVCARNGYVISGDIEIVRVILQSLACKYRYVAEQIEHMTKRSYDVLYILGGGGKNECLNRLAADVMGKTIVAGPSDATAIGNILMQWLGRGLIRDLQHGRSIVRDSVELRTYEPQNRTQGEQLYRKFCEMMKNKNG